MLDWSTCQAVERDPAIVSGAWVFRGTRVPVSALFENLESGATVDQFLEWFPGVGRNQVDAVLEHTARSLQTAWHAGRMRILFDQGAPVPLKQHLPGHQVETAYDLGWSRLTNGELLAAAEGRFDVFVTTDQHLRYQQELSGRKLAILVLPTTSWPRLREQIQQIAAAVDTLKPGDYVELSL